MTVQWTPNALILELIPARAPAVIPGSVLQVVVKVGDQVIADMCPLGRVQLWLENDAIPYSAEELM